MTWDATWWWLVVYLVVGFFIAVAAASYWDEDEPLNAVGAMLLWPVVIVVGIVYAIGVLIVVAAGRR